jgi:hypothetical protein
MPNNLHDCGWTHAATPPPTPSAVLVRLVDGAVDLLWWTGERWLPDPGRKVGAWTQLADLQSAVGFRSGLATDH